MHKSLLALALPVGLLLPNSLDATQVTAGMSDLSVVSHHFTTSISSGRNRLTVTDPGEGRYIVLLMKGSFSSNGGRVFTYDFLLRYTRNRLERRGACRAIAPGDTSGAPAFGRFLVGYGSFISADEDTRYFGLACYIQPNTSTVEIFRMGAADRVNYRVGSDRPYSVFVTTNRPRATMTNAVQAIESGGYQVKTSTRLRASTKGITIHYTQKAETQAREIAQRLMTALDVVPTVKKMSLASTHDVVVWLGKDP